MPDYRRLVHVAASVPALEGAGVRLNRVFGNREPERMDPFLLLDYFRSDDPDDFMAGFPWHPHRGIETVTYVLKGRVEHGDSLGNRGVIGPGDVQWMTAGSGIIHEEMPVNAGGLQGFQLWVNLPGTHKMMAPRYREVAASSIPAVDAGGGTTVRVVAGECGGRTGPVRDIVTSPSCLDVAMPAASVFEHAVPRGHNVFVFVFEGEVVADHSGRRVPSGTVAQFGDGDAVRLATEAAPARFLLASGRPLREPIAWYGPIVMNTQEELEEAFGDYQRGTFIRPAAT